MSREHFDWADPFQLHDQLTPDERIVQETARSYANRRLAPRVLEAFRHEQLGPEADRPHRISYKKLVRN